MNGVIVVDKPNGVTSHDVVEGVRRAAGADRAGHFGTLDPLATGVLPVAIGRATRLQQFYLHARKSYTGTIHFGFATNTYDSQGNPTSEPKSVSLIPEKLLAAGRQFLGEIEQTPPAFSAKKIQGIAAHRLARKNRPVALKPVRIHVYRFELFLKSSTEAHFEIECSAGTYVRSIAHDLGQVLRCGAHLTALRRTASGDFTLENAVSWSPEIFEPGQKPDPALWEQYLIPLKKLLLWMPAAIVPSDDCRRVRNGMAFRSKLEEHPSPQPSGAEIKEDQWIRILEQNGDLIGVGMSHSSNQNEAWAEIKPKIILRAD